MRNRSYFGATVVIGISMILLWSASASAAMWGAETYVRTSEGNTAFNYTGDGGAGVDHAYSSITDDRGEGQAEAFLGLSPTIKAESIRSGEITSGRVYADAWAIEGYTFNGADAQTLTLDITLTGNVYNIEGTDSNSLARINAEILAFRSENFVYSTDLATLLNEYGAQLMAGDYGEEGFSGLYLGFSDDETSTVSGSFNLTVDPGETFYIWTNLHTGARASGSFADAFNTLSLDFQDNSNLTAASASAVPLPPAFLLFGSSIAGLVLIRRRKRV